MQKLIMETEDLIKPSNFKPMAVSDGTYHSIIVGVIVTHKHFDAKGKTPEKDYNAIRLAVEIMDDENEAQILQTADMNLSFNEKSTLYKMLSSWTKATSPNNLWDKLKESGVCSKTFDYEKLLGKHVGIQVSMKTSKTDESKTYPEITSLIPAKAKDKFDAVPEKNIWIRKYDDVIDVQALEGFAVKYPEDKEEGTESAAPAQAEGVDADGNLPF